MFGHTIQAAVQRELASKNGTAGHTGTPGAVQAASVNTRSHWGDTQGDKAYLRYSKNTTKSDFVAETTEGPHAHTDTAAFLQLTNRQTHTQSSYCAVFMWRHECSSNHCCPPTKGHCGSGNSALVDRSACGCKHNTSVFLMHFPVTSTSTSNAGKHTQSHTLFYFDHLTWSKSWFYMKTPQIARWLQVGRENPVLGLFSAHAVLWFEWKTRQLADPQRLHRMLMS